MGVYIGEPISDMQGPAPSGFHVPSSAEWVALCGILTTTFSMARNATTMGTYLKMPVAGLRSYNVGNANNVGSYGYYWSSSPYTNDNSRGLFFSSYTIRASDSIIISIAAFIRCFKDSSVIPTSSWTKLYDGSSVATGAGVFHNAADGLISISGDGQTWYTIQDKNLGATTVFNQGDTLTDANCGNVFQRGNNYAFPGTLSSDSITTSSTQVDASTYGPGNYYSSSTYITRLSSPHNWSSVQNDNLWGGVTQGTTTKSTDLKNAYIGEYRVPGANTIAYYPLTSSTTVNDKSGNNRNLTNSNVSFGTQFGVDCAYISGNADSSHSVSKYLYGNITGLPTGSGARTYSFWIYNNNANIPSVADDMYIFQGQSSTNKMVFINGGGVDSRSGLAISQRGSSGNFGASIRQQRCHNVITYDGTKFEWYVNGVSRGTWTYTINTGSNKFSVFGASENGYWNAFNGGMSELILENKARTAQEIADYYNLTKSNYGL